MSVRSAGRKMGWLMGVGRLRILRSRSPIETAAFWIVLAMSYLTLSFLAGARGIGYAERVDPASRTIAFDLNPFLWFPDLFLHAWPPSNPVPFLLWWVVLAAVIAEGVMVLMRFLRGGARPGADQARSPEKSRPA